MTDGGVERLIVCLIAGLGMLLVGGLNLLPGRTSRWVRTTAVGLAFVAAVYAFSEWYTDPTLFPRAIALTAVGVIPCLLLGSRFAGWLLERLRRPAVHWGGLCAVGVGVVVAANVRYDEAAAAEYRRSESAFDAGLAVAYPPLTEEEEVRAVTDRGTAVPLQTVLAARSTTELSELEHDLLRLPVLRDRVLRRTPADDAANCHGWMFAGGRYWVPSSAVEMILRENGYSSTAAPETGDLIVYRRDGAVVHSGVVRYIADGMPVMVESKWAWMGVFLHAADGTTYGADWTCYRSPRAGHLLDGINSPIESPPTGPVNAVE